MIDFRIKVRVCEDFDLWKQVRSPALPRIGEEVWAEIDQASVVNIRHYLFPDDGEEPRIVVEVENDLIQDFESFTKFWTKKRVGLKLHSTSNHHESFRASVGGFHFSNYIFGESIQ